jgi:hypothetical protein
MTMQPKPSSFSALRLAEVMATLSLASDLGMGQPLEFALTTCVLATRLSESLGMPPSDLRDVYYFGLLRFIGCNSDTYAIAALLGDELSLRSAFAAVDPGSAAQVLNVAIRFMRQAHAGAAPLDMARTLLRGVLSLPQFMKDQFSGHCEVAQRLAERLGFGTGLLHALGQVYERWDGKGLPHGLRGEAVSPAVLLVTLAQDVVTYQRLGNLDSAVQMVRARSVGAYDPRHAEHFCANATALMQGLDDEPSWELVLACEPGERLTLTEAQFDTACQALADFADIKSPYTLGHSPRRRRTRLGGCTNRRAGRGRSVGALAGRIAARPRPRGHLRRHLDKTRLADRAGMGAGATASIITPSAFWRARQR